MQKVTKLLKMLKYSELVHVFIPLITDSNNVRLNILSMEPPGL